MICKSREHENKFVSILSKDVIKHLLDVFEATDGWKSFLKFSVYKKPSCTKCKKSFCNDKNLMTHIKKYHSETTALRCDLCDIVCKTETELKAHNESNHTNNKIIQCELCKITFETENFLKTHIIKKHPRDTDIKCEKCDYTVDIDNERFMIDHTQQAHQNLDLQEEDDNEMEIDDKNDKREDNDNKVKILEDCIKRMEKEDLRKSNEIKKLKEENKTILEKLGQLQWNKDKMDAELKAKEKTEKIKRNMKMFNDIVGQKEDIKEKNDVENEMEVVECDEISELYTLQQNKKNGSMRTTPQESSEVRRRIENCEKKVINCPQCDFKTPSERFFNEHMSLIHTGPNCPFCFLPFNGYADLRKHCNEVHTESRHNSRNSKYKKPCRYFRNGEGNCSPRNGEECEFDHSIIPFSERQECFHKQSCKYKPYCIFYHPEGQNIENWQMNTRKVSKICHYSQQGLNCMRSECRYYHPVIKNYQDFQMDHLKKPPIMINSLTVKRVPVIVKNTNLMNYLSQSLKGMEME